MFTMMKPKPLNVHILLRKLPLNVQLHVTWILHSLIFKNQITFLKHFRFEYNSDLLRTYSIAFHPESEFELISAGWSRYIQFFDARVPNMFVTKCAAPKVIGEGLSFHPSGGEVKL